MSIIREVMGGIGAALAAYIINKLLFKYLGEKSIVYLVPLSEEIAKTSWAMMVHGYIPGVHIVFGIIEAVYDFFHGKNKRAGVLAGLISIVSHSIFGMMTDYLYRWTHGITISILIAAGVHGIWNYFATR